MDQQSFIPNQRYYDLHPLGSLASIVTFFLIICALFAVFQIFYIVSDLELAGKVSRGEQVDEQVLIKHVETWNVLFWTNIAIMIVTGILFIRWFHRAYCNVAQFEERGTKYSTKWAVWGWLVPILNLFRPYAIGKEIWERSIVRGSSSQVVAVTNSSHSLVGYWWGSFVISGALERTAYRVSLHSESLEAAIVSDYISLAASAATVIAAFIAMSFVRELSARHERAIRSYQSPVGNSAVLQPGSW